MFSLFSGSSGSRMGVFENCSVLLELKDLSFKEKKKLKSAVTANGGSVSFVVNKKVRELVWV